MRTLISNRLLKVELYRYERHANDHDSEVHDSIVLEIHGTDVMSTGHDRHRSKALVANSAADLVALGRSLQDIGWELEQMGNSFRGMSCDELLEEPTTPKFVSGAVSALNVLITYAQLNQKPATRFGLRKYLWGWLQRMNRIESDEKLGLHY
jgi:hypothetical protein